MDEKESLSFSNENKKECFSLQNKLVFSTIANLIQFIIQSIFINIRKRI